MSTSPARSPNRKTWWKKSMSQRIESFIEGQVSKAMEGSSFFQDSEAESTHPSENNCEPVDSDPMNNKERPLRIHRSGIVLGDLLGQGAFSEVYDLRALAVEDESNTSFLDTEDGSIRTAPLDAHDDKRYAVKHLRKELQSNRSAFQDAAAKLIMEAKFLARLRHPNIVEIKGWAAGEAASYSSGSHDGFFLILEKVDETLTQRIQRWKQGELVGSMKTKLTFGLRIASALRYIHSRRIIFRDLKPCNVGIIGAGTIKLIDFGLCRSLPEQPDNEDGTFHMTGRTGSRRYMAPEVFLRCGYNLAADVYSWSILFYEMLSLHPSFDFANDMVHEMLVCCEGVRPELNKSWPVPVKELLQLCWQDSIAERLSMTDVCDVLIRTLSAVDQ